MASFDIVSKVDPQTLDNAVNITKKEILNRFDFKASPVKIELNKKDMKIELEAESDMKVKQIVDVLISRSMKQGIDPLAYDLTKEPYPSGKVTKMEVPVRNGLKQDDAKKVVKLIKDSGMKVQALGLERHKSIPKKALKIYLKQANNSNLKITLYMKSTQLQILV